jgi:hypothetical protein
VSILNTLTGWSFISIFYWFFVLTTYILKELLKAPWLVERVALDLTAHQDKDACCDGKDFPASGRLMLDSFKSHHPEQVVKIRPGAGPGQN